MSATLDRAEDDAPVMLKCGCAAHAKRKVGEEWVPSCIVHDCIEQVSPPDLTGRMASCNCGNKQPSSMSLAFFEYRGPGSPDSTTMCKCGYFESAHKNYPERLRCKQFVPRGPWETDSYYCGCRGWN